MRPDQCFEQHERRPSKAGTASPPIVTTYHYDTEQPHPNSYGTFNNRLMWYEVAQGSTVIQRTWFVYNYGGQPTRIITHYPAGPQSDCIGSPGTYHSTDRQLCATWS